MLSGSDVKIHGVNIGKVSTIKLVDGRALIRVTIKKSETIPVDARGRHPAEDAVRREVHRHRPRRRPRRVDRSSSDGDTIKDTLGGFELERILSDLYPVLKEIKPERTRHHPRHARPWRRRRTGANVNHEFQNLAAFATGQAGNVRETEQFIDDLAALSQTLADHADEAIAGVRDAHEALPVLNARTDEFTSVLKNTARLTGDVADILEANTPLLQQDRRRGRQAS